MTLLGRGAVAVGGLALLGVTGWHLQRPRTPTRPVFREPVEPDVIKTSDVCIQADASFGLLEDEFWSAWRMSLPEKRQFDAALRLRPGFRFVEFGSGGSTRYATVAAERLGGQACSFEMAAKWHKMMINEEFFSCPQTAHLRFHAVDAEVPLGAWSAVQDKGNVVGGLFDDFIFAFSEHACLKPNSRIHGVSDVR